MMLESNKKGLFECGYIILVPYRRVKTLPQESMYEVDARRSTDPSIRGLTS